MRCRVGIYNGPIDRVTPHVKTGRADYFGQPVNRAARLMSAAHGGQIVCERSLMDSVLEEWHARYGDVARLSSDRKEDSIPSPRDLRTARSFISSSFTK